MIRIGICGYGNLGKGVEEAIKYSKDMELVAIFSRRDIQTAVPLIKIEDMEQYRKKIDVVIMCGGSAKDLPNQVPQFAKIYNTVDSFDTHKNIPEYIEKINRINRESNTISLISAGWDPGLFSINRLYSEAIIPNAHTYTFWGKGVSQGHSDAIRKINGVKNAIQYTIPIDSEIEKARRGEILCLTNEQKHLRECFVVPEEGADLEEVITKAPEAEEKPYTMVEQMPQFPGGDRELLSFIAKNLRYPTIAQENGIQGKVFVRFVVSATGDVKDVKVMRSLDPYCDKEAIRVIQSLPKWIPGKQNGRNVPVYYTVPITFKLQ